ncbi:MAG: plasmid pRiA4b ORF-3 family protein [Ferruginibacter sp.]
MKKTNLGMEAASFLDLSKTLLTDVVSLEKDSFHYNYDFGDCWLHEISIDQLVEKEAGTLYPTCIGGQLNCPPEDCGGIAGFNNIKIILQDKKHPEYKEIRNWVGKNYDTKGFDQAKVNKQLRQLQKYISRWNSPD